MQTEQQKILWIIFSVALFILVIVGVGVIWFLPSNNVTVTGTAKTKAGGQAKISFDPYEWAKSQANNYPGLESAPSGQTKTGQNGQGSGNFTIIYGQQPEQGQSSTVAQQPPQPKAAARPAVKPVTPAPAPPARKVTAPPPRAVAPTPAPARKRVSPPPEVTRIAQHWIQVASFTSDFRAQRAKKVLDQNGIAGRIVTHEIHGRTFFRVRVGPYTTQQEAEKFLGQIKKISEFRNSYISLAYSVESAN